MLNDKRLEKRAMHDGADDTIRNIHTLVPVTALTVWGGLMVAGVGHYLCFYELEGGKEIYRQRIFQRQTIHGIVVKNTNKNRILVWGGQYLAFLTKHNAAPSANNVVLSNIIRAPDWILKACLAFEGTSRVDEAFLVTAHNVLCSLRRTATQDGTDGPYYAAPLAQISKDMLYSAEVIMLTESMVMVAAGTVFGKILLWTYDASSNRPTCRIHDEFEGHEGSIFGISISGTFPPSNLFPFKHRLLASCSDDRTIRVWRITDFSDDRSASKVAKRSSLLIERTGQGFSESQLIAVSAMRHVSRVWKVQFFPQTQSTALSVEMMSAGEDASIRHWRLLSPADRAQGASEIEFRHISALFSHSGKNLWSLAMYHDEDTGELFALTGGGDGRIVRCKLGLGEDIPLRSSVTGLDAPNAKEVQEQAHQNTLQDPVAFTRKHKSENHDIRSYAFVGSKTLLVITNRGGVYRLDLAQAIIGHGIAEPRHNWRYLDTLNDLIGYSTITSLQSVHMGLIGAASGSIYAYDARQDTLTLMYRAPGKISGLFLQRAAGFKNGERTVHALATVLGTCHPFHLIMFFNDAGAALMSTHQIKLGPANKFVVTSVLMLPDSDLLFLGARDGRLAAYQSRFQQDPILVHPGPDIDDAVTGLEWVSDRWLFTTSRNGLIKAYEIHHSPKSLVLHKVHELAVHLRPCLEGIFKDATDRIIVYGFHDTRFLVYDAMREWPVLSIECGGAHRTWSVLFANSSNQNGSLEEDAEYQVQDQEYNSSQSFPNKLSKIITLAWTKAGRLHIETPEHAARTLTSRGHGREIKACASRPKRFPVTRMGEEPSLLPMFATGSEDTDIRLFILSNSTLPVASENESNAFECITTIRKHTTGIQHLDWSEDGDLLFSCGGCEEFYVWQIRAIPLLVASVLCKSTCPRTLNKGDLRIMGFVQEKLKHEKMEEDAYRIIMIFSDSSVESYKYTSRPSQDTWELLTSGTYLSSCLTQVCHINNHEHENSHGLLLTGATDGHIALWRSYESFGQDSLRWMSRHRVHQNAVSSLCVANISPTVVLICTGGDDNAIGISILDTEASINGQINEDADLKTLLIPKAHAAAVTALLISHSLNDKSTGLSMTLISAGGDQRIKTWYIKIDTNQPSIRNLEVTKGPSTSSAIADIAAMNPMPGERRGSETRRGVLVCGAGMELWQATDASPRLKAHISPVDLEATNPKH